MPYIPGMGGGAGGLSSRMLQEKRLRLLAQQQREQSRQQELQSILQPIGMGLSAVNTAMGVLDPLVFRPAQQTAAIELGQKGAKELQDLAQQHAETMQVQQQGFTSWENEADRMAREKMAREGRQYETASQERELAARTREQLQGQKLGEIAARQAAATQAAGAERGARFQHGLNLEMLSAEEKGRQARQAEQLASAERIAALTGPGGRGEADIKAATHAGLVETFQANPFFQALGPGEQSEIMQNPTGPNAEFLHELNMLQGELAPMEIQLSPGAEEPADWTQIDTARQKAEAMYGEDPERLEQINEWLRAHAGAQAGLPEPSTLTIMGAARNQPGGWLDRYLKYREWLGLPPAQIPGFPRAPGPLELR